MDGSFARFVEFDTNGGCWLWTGALNEWGYGRVAERGRPILAHRASWQAAKGPIPDGLCVLHRCDVRPCVNPSHLFLGTVAENNADRAAKGRTCRGERMLTAKLSEAAVREILNSPLGDTALARRFGVDRTTIRQVRERVSWRHVEAS